MGNRKHRITWSRNLIHWAADRWEQVVFSDECRFGLKNAVKFLRIWCTSAETNYPRFFSQLLKVQFPSCFGVCIGPNGVGRLVFCEDSVNATKYIAILQNNLLQSIEKMLGDDGRPFIFQQDNTLPHRSKITNNFWKEASIGVLPWPLQSPDLNIIENIWLYKKNRQDKP